MSITIGEALAKANTLLVNSSDSPRVDSEYLLSYVLNKPRTYLKTFADQVLAEKEQQHFYSLLSRRQQGEPVAYIVGSQGFWSLLLNTTTDTLIPRPETELLVEEVLALCGDIPKIILDLGVGTGAIALALASERPQWQVYGSDVSRDALNVAEQNRAALNLTNVSFKQGVWCEPWRDMQFDIIVSNPPYICENDEHLQNGDVRFEPRLALVSGVDGLDAIRVIAKEARNLLKKDGWLLIEHGFDQGQMARDIFADNGYAAIQTLQDLNGHDRVCKAQWI